MIGCRGMISFHTKWHDLKPGVQILEIRVNGQMAATIYPDGEKGVKVVSAHFVGLGGEDPTEFTRHISINDGRGEYPPIPSVDLAFNVSPYTYHTGRVVKPPQTT